MFETTDGSRPHFSGLADDVQRQFPLAAFAILDTGDAFESLSGKPPADALAKAREVLSHWDFVAHGATEAQGTRVRSDIERQLSGNTALSQRLLRARPLTLELLPGNPSWPRFGFPHSVAPNTSGLFWDQPGWPRARLAVRQDRLSQEPHLVFHEVAHAIACLAFTQAERDLLYRKLLRTYRNEATIDEVFAIYTEREFVPAYRSEDHRAPGIYGHARRRWHEDQVVTRFVRHLYFPWKALAGPKVGQGNTFPGQGFGGG